MTNQKQQLKTCPWCRRADRDRFDEAHTYPDEEPYVGWEFPCGTFQGDEDDAPTQGQVCKGIVIERGRILAAVRAIDISGATGDVKTAAGSLLWDIKRIIVGVQLEDSDG